MLPENSVLLIKTHPEEERDKYKHLESSHVKVFNSLGIEEMTQMPDLIIGMASMLLIELAMFRDDIISYRPNASKSFIGEKIAATHHAGTKAHLKEYIYNSPSSLAMPFRKKFKGSGERISKFLYNLT